MRKGIIVAVVAVLALLVVGVVGCGDYFGSSEPSYNKEISSDQHFGISVVGTGKITATPDVAILSLGVEAEAATVAEAQQLADSAMDGIMGAFDSHDIADEDIQTQRYSIYPVREYKEESTEIVGYRVSNIVTVKVRDMDGIGSVIDDVAAAGGDYTVINSITFTLDKPEDYYEDARKEAMEDAEDKAQQLADLSGVDLGAPISITETTSYYNDDTIYYEDGRYAGESIATPSAAISVGELEVTINVAVVYDIE
jgi:uncharacterized protein YggE